MAGRLSELERVRSLPVFDMAPSAELRRQFMEQYFRPVIECMFEKEPRLDAVQLCFAQYWDDNADDAVHDWIVPLVDRDLSLLDAETVRNAPFAVEHDGWTSLSFSLEDDAADEVFGGRGYWDNGPLVVAFASYTKEGSTNQDMDRPEAYLPYALFVREAEGIVCTLTGEMLRPHLEDQPSSWMRGE